jgi:hypothetical protein
MANPAAVRFVKQLCAAFSRYPITAETRELYANKLSGWRLTQNEWDTAADRIIEVQTDDNLPSLSIIYGYLKNAKASQRDDTNGGLATFDLNGMAYGLRVRNDGGVWLIADVVMRDAHGKEVHLQKHVGEAFGLHVPKDAYNVMVSPDNPADPLPEDTPSPAEVHEIVSVMVKQWEGKGHEIL